jgi:hypothetical protein
MKKVIYLNSKWLIFVLVIILGNNTIYSQQSNRQSEEEASYPYLMITMPINNIGGEFSGEDALSGENIVIPIEKFKNGIGYGITAGGFVDKHVLLDVTYTRSNHDGEWQTYRFKGYQNLIAMDLKLTPVDKSPVVPYILAGGAFAILKVKEGAITANDLLDVAFKDFAWRLGAGVQVHIWNVILRADWIYNFIKYTSATPKGKDWSTIDGNLIAPVKSINIGIGYLFR